MNMYKYIPTPVLPPTPPPHPQRVRSPMGVNKTWSIKLRQDQAPPLSINPKHGTPP